MQKPPELDVRRIERWCSGRVPPAALDQLRMESKVRGSNVTIFETRASWDREDGEWTRRPYAQVRYGNDGNWTLFWPDRNSRWIRIPDVVPTPNLASVLDYIAENPKGYFG